MSGGYWNYQDMKLSDRFDCLRKLPKILDVLEEVFHEIDLAESGDSARPEKEKLVYDALLKLGDELFD